MKKHFDKVVSIALTAIALLFVVFLLIMIFDSEFAVDANNRVVQILFIVFASLFGVLATLSIISAFNDQERVNQILLFKTKYGAKKASISVIRKLAKTAVTPIDAVKIGHIHVYVDDNSNAYLRATVKIVPKKKNGAPEDKASVILEKVNAALQLEFIEVLNLEFKEVELKLIKTRHYAAPDIEKINQRATEQQALVEAQREAEKQLENQFNQYTETLTAEKTENANPNPTAESITDTPTLEDNLNTQPTEKAEDWRFEPPTQSDITENAEQEVEA